MKLRQLFGALEGGAANVTDEREMSEWTYTSLMDALASRYTPRHNQYTLMNKLKNMTQGSKTYQEFMDDISREVEYAQISNKETARGKVVEVFVGGVTNPHVKQYLMEQEPKTKHEALKLALSKHTLYVAAFGGGDAPDARINVAKAEFGSRKTTYDEHNSEKVRSDIGKLKEEKDRLRREVDELKAKSIQTPKRSPSLQPRFTHGYRDNFRGRNRPEEYSHGYGRDSGRKYPTPSGNSNYNSNRFSPQRGGGQFVRGRGNYRDGNVRSFNCGSQNNFDQNGNNLEQAIAPLMPPDSVYHPGVSPQPQDSNFVGNNQPTPTQQ